MDKLRGLLESAPICRLCDFCNYYEKSEDGYCVADSVNCVDAIYKQIKEEILAEEKEQLEGYSRILCNIKEYK